jgi:drug/metabolite transporter (DMT)-like permease
VIERSLASSATMMKTVGWATLVVIPLMALAFPAGFFWGTSPESPHHPPLSPYAFMLVAMYVAWAVLMIRGAKDPVANKAIVDYGILANLLHGLLMFVQAFLYVHEMQHLWGDVPVLLAMCVVLWIWHPSRVTAARPSTGSSLR